MRHVTEAPELWKLLNGIICVYKPQGMPALGVRKTVIGNIVNELNEFPCRPPAKLLIKDHSNNLRVVPNLADNPLVVGPRYLPNDVRCAWTSHVGKHTSGVFVLAINRGNLLNTYLRESRPVRVYHVSGKLGIATDTYDIHGAIVERSSFNHVKISIIDRVSSSIQAAHQRSMFDHMGVPLHSQAAYELAAQGTVRPPDGKIPFLYSVKCVEFTSPDFTIEVKCANENESYLKTLIHDIGMKVHSAASCTTIRCIRYGPFTLEHALLRRHWHLQPIFDNLSLCRRILREHKILTHDPPASLVANQTASKLLETYN